MQQLLVALVFCAIFISQNGTASASGISPLLYAGYSKASEAVSLQALSASPEGKVIMIRHALAPGTGDPADFILDDCSTQRNLDDRGRAQATRLGQLFRDAGIVFRSVHSSQWCRCLETADLMNMGEVQPLAGLNSFYQGIVDREKTLAMLRQFLASQPADAGPLVLVTHFVTISAVTGFGVGSGEAVVIDLKSAKASRLDLPQ